MKDVTASQAIEQVLKTNVRETLPKDAVVKVPAAAPFVDVLGVFNVRDLSEPNGRHSH